MNDDFSESGQEVLSDESETFNEIMKIYQKEIKNKKSYRSSKLPPDVATMMGEANQFFMFNKFDDAIQKAYEIISKYPDYPEPYHLLGLIYEEQSNKKRAAHFYTLAAQLTQSDSRLWEKIGNLYKEAQCYEQACYSFGRALKSDPNNKMLMIERAECYELAGDIRKAIKCIEKFINNTPDNILIVKKCAKLYTKIGQTNKSIELLENFLKKEEEIDYNIVNMICELYLKDALYADCIKFINRIVGAESEEYQQNPEKIAEKLQDIPLEIITKYGLCCGKTDQKQLAEMAFNILIKDDINNYSDLFEEAAECYEQLGEFEKALKIYEKLLELPEYSSSEIWLKVGVLYRKIKDQKAAKNAFNAVIEKNPEKFEAKVYLSEIYVDEGKMEDALQILGGFGNYETEQNKDEDVYLSDDEHMIAIKHDQPIGIKLPKKMSYYERDTEVYKKVKHDKGETKRIPKPDIIPSTKPFKLTKENIEARIHETQLKYPIDHFILRFAQAKILLDSGHEKDFLETIVEPLIQSLHLEIEIQDIRMKILNRFLYESQKKSFKRRVESGMEFETHEMEQNILLKTKKTKIPSEILQKRKTKFSAYLTDKQFEHVKTMSKELGKSQYYQTALKCLDLLDKFEDYGNTAIICELLIKLKSEYVKELPKLPDDIYLYGFLSNFKLEQYEKSFYYIKYFSKSRTDDNFIQALLAICLQKVEDPAVYRVFMSKLQIKDLDRECEAITQILANNYLQTGFYELCINTGYKLHKMDKTNPYYNLLLGVAFLQSACSRTTVNKPQMIIRAFECLDNYFEVRVQTHCCESHYNLGRAYSQLSMFPDAIDCYNKAMRTHLQRLSVWSKTFEDKAKPSDCDNVFEKAVYNLIMIHNHLGNTDIVKQLINDFMVITE